MSAVRKEQSAIGVWKTEIALSWENYKSFMDEIIFEIN